MANADSKNTSTKSGDHKEDIDPVLHARQRRNERALLFLSSITTSNTAVDNVPLAVRGTISRGEEPPRADTEQTGLLPDRNGYYGLTLTGHGKQRTTSQSRKDSLAVNPQAHLIANNKHDVSSGTIDIPAFESAADAALSNVNITTSIGGDGDNDDEISSNDSDYGPANRCKHTRNPSNIVDDSTELQGKHQATESLSLKPSTFPMVFAPIKPFSGKNDDKHRHGNNADGGSEQVMGSNANRTDQSFAYFLHPLHTLTPSAEAGHSDTCSNSVYHPSKLDDLGLHKGLQRSLYGLAGYMGTIFDYAKPDEHRQDTNGGSREIQLGLSAAGLTLDQLRRLKAYMLRVMREQDLELSTAAIGWVYFEKLIWKGYVVKDNRKLVAAVCLFLALKINESREVSVSRSLQVIQRRFEVSADSILDQEFSVFAELEFSLWVPRREFMPHFLRMFEAIGMFCY
ncbi:hypothetical protein EDC05_005033 [Coemansia umbellata]|uniref:Cyclin N-terminal domain-containing protein n=1 Tax=Coemansia umbellata TaxID=1424467 RepID=A0ABQ8PHL6_9FUNG|nr:hypothetical protein EDC05_005033 [Coemansia umbellata]